MVSPAGTAEGPAHREARLVLEGPPSAQKAYILEGQLFLQEAIVYYMDSKLTSIVL